MIEIVERRVQALIDRTDPALIGGMFSLSLEHYDAGAGEFRFFARTAPWMANSAGALHGGMGAALADQAMSYIARAVKPEGAVTATLQLQTDYHRPLGLEEELLVRVYAVNIGHSVMHFRCEISALGAPDKLCLSAKGIFHNKY